VVLALLIGTAAGADYNRRLPREYTATASVLVYPAGQNANMTGGRTRDEINLDTEARLVRSTAVVAYAAKELKRDDAEALSAGVTVEVPPNTSVLQIKFTDQTASGAQAGAHAFAEAYLRNREENAKAAALNQMEALKGMLQELTGDLAAINSQLNQVNRNSASYASLESQRETALGQINQLTNRINQLGTDTVKGGVIIRDARVPGRPFRPHTPVNLAAGGLLGLLVGIGGAAILLRGTVPRSRSPRAPRS
jgi:uncharacterized protein involved in exopolysaccharide biosynthesis